MPFQWNAYGDTNFDGISVPDTYSYSYRITQPYADGYGYSNHYAYCYVHCNGYCDFHSHFHPNYDSTTNSDIYTYGYFDDYTQANPYAQAACNAEGTTHPTAAPESVIAGLVVRLRSGPGSTTPATVCRGLRSLSPCR